MTNKELSIILRLRDEATKRLEGVRAVCRDLLIHGSRIGSL